MLESLKDLSDRATPGIWYTVDTPWGEGDWIVAGNPDPHAGLFVCLFDGSVVGVLPNDDDASADAAENAAFVAELVNAYRSGQLHDATALAEAEARGYARGLEEAAKVAEGIGGVHSTRYVGKRIRILLALATTPAETQKPEEDR